MINIAEILSNYPLGTELYSPAFGVVKLKMIRPHLAVVVTDTQNVDWEVLYDGRFSFGGECVLFPSKENRDWETLQQELFRQETMKTLKIDVPNGYEIDKEKSTFENIVFKKKDKVIIQWERRHCGVEIKDDGEHFIVGAYQPSFYCSWNDAMRHYVKSTPWVLPTINQLKVIAKHLDNVNKIIRENNGFEIKDWLWSREEKNEFCAWGVYMNDGCTGSRNKNFYNYVRAVSAF